jgi:hypothetical protein
MIGSAHTIRLGIARGFAREDTAVLGHSCQEEDAEKEALGNVKPLLERPCFGFCRSRLDHVFFLLADGGG